MKKMIVKVVVAGVGAAVAAALLTGCYVGKAAFQGEKMQIYPLFSTSGTTCAEAENNVE